MVSFVCRVMEPADVEIVELRALSARSLNRTALHHSVVYLKAASGVRWVVDADSDRYLYPTLQLPGSARVFHFYSDGVDVRLEVADGLYQRTTMVRVLDGCKADSFHDPIRTALMAWYGDDEMFAVHPVFEGEGR